MQVYVLWQLIYCSWYYFAKGSDLVTVARLLLGSYDHLWYLPMIAGLYLVTPLLRPIARRRQLLEYYLLLTLLLAWILPTCLALARLWPNAPKHLTLATAALSRLLGKLNVKIVMGYGGYYMAGFIQLQFLLCPAGEQRDFSQPADLEAAGLV